MFSRLGLKRHVSDADLAAVWTDARLGAPAQTAAAAHVRECAGCRARLSSLSAWLDGLRTDARREAEEVFTREHLAAQQAQIFRRLEAMERPAKVLAFPRFTTAMSVRNAGRQRWIAAAAVAGLVVGIGLGQVVDFRRVINRKDGFAGSGTQIARTVPDRMGVQPVSAAGDESFLYDQEPSLSTAAIPESLRSLHEITPSARDYDPR
jgi:hypothetical protein